MKRLFLLPLAALVLCISNAKAQAPRTISFQGVLVTPSGTPIPNGTHTVTLKMYDASSAVVFTENQTVTSVNGVFNAIIGSSATIPASLDFNQPLSLGMAVDGGAELSPRTPLAAVPYAFYANVASQAKSLAPGATGVVTSLNSASGDVVLQGGGGTTVNRTGNTILISSSGGGGTGISGVQSSAGSLTIVNANGPVADLSIADGGVTASKIADGAVINTKLADGAVTTPKLGDGAVTTPKLGDGSVTTIKVQDGAITAPKISVSGATTGYVLTNNGSSAAWSAPGLLLPFSASTATNSDAFSITGSGTGGTGFFKNTNTAPLKSALYGEVNGTSASTLIAGVEGKSANGFGIIGHGGSGSSGIFGAVITTATPGAYYAGTGVSGFSDVSNGVGGITYASTGSGVYGTATGTGTGVQGVSTAGRAGYFTISTSSNTSNALEATTNGSGYGLYATNTATTGSTSGVRGEVSSTANGIGANGGVSGVMGLVNPTSPGGYSAGVRGVNNGTGGTGIGVIGYQGGSGWGVYGETPSGFGVYGLTTNTTAASSGVRGETFSANGIGVEAKYSGSGVGIALEVDNGAIRAAGTNKFVFVHTATAANKLSANGTDVTNPLCDGDPNAILIVTQKLNPSGIVYNNSPVGVYYNTIRNKWEIFNENNTAIPTNAQFNVLVVKQ